MVQCISDSTRGIPWDYFNLISNGFLSKGEKDEKKIAEGRQRYDAALAERVLAKKEKPELIVLAGWMHVFSGAFLEPMEKAGVKIINLHPALPGKFKDLVLRLFYSQLEQGSLMELMRSSEPLKSSKLDD